MSNPQSAIRPSTDSGRPDGLEDRNPQSGTPGAYLTWPNRFTLLRLLLVAPFVVLLQNHQSRPVYRYLALGLFMFMAFSDLLDGYLARRLNCRTRLGAILDPLADKVLIVCAAVLLSLPHSAVKGARLPDWVVVTIVGKDLWVIIGFLIIFLLTGKVFVAPSAAGKICTAGQVAMVAAVLISPELNLLGPPIGTYLTRILWWAVAGMCLLSVISYTRIGLACVEEADRSDKGSTGL